MTRALDGHEVKAIVALHEAGNLVAVHGVLHLPLSPGRLDGPLETFDPALGAVGRNDTIGVARVVHHFHVATQDIVDPLGRLIEHLVVLLDSLRALAPRSNLAGHGENISDVLSLQEVYEGDLSVSVHLLVHVGLRVMAFHGHFSVVVPVSSAEAGVLAEGEGTIVHLLHGGAVAGVRTVMLGAVVFMRVVVTVQIVRVQSSGQVLRLVEEEVAWLRAVGMRTLVSIVEIAFQVVDAIIQIRGDHVEAVQRVSPAAVSIVLPVRHTVADKETLQRNLRAVLDSLVGVVSVDLPREVGHVDATIRLTRDVQVAVLVLREELVELLEGSPGILRLRDIIMDSVSFRVGHGEAHTGGRLKIKHVGALVP